MSQQNAAFYKFVPYKAIIKKILPSCSFLPPFLWNSTKLSLIKPFSIKFNLHKTWVRSFRPPGIYIFPFVRFEHHEWEGKVKSLWPFFAAILRKKHFFASCELIILNSVSQPFLFRVTLPWLRNNLAAPQASILSVRNWRRPKSFFRALKGAAKPRLRTIAQNQDENFDNLKNDRITWGFDIYSNTNSL